MPDKPVPPDNVVIVGAGLAGMSTARELRSQGFAGAITLLGEEPHPPYDRPPLSKQFLTGEWDADRLRHPGHDELPDSDVTVRLNSRAEACDLARRTVTLHDGTAVPFDHLVVATGVAARGLPTSGRPPLRMRSLDDARHAATELRPGRRVVVIGSGFMGTEMAWAARALGCEVWLVGMDPAPLPGLGPDVGEAISRSLTNAGVTLMTATGVSDVHDRPDGGQNVALADGTQLEADTVFCAVGSVPRVEWLHGNGLDLSDGLGCDATCRAAPDVHGAGDVARWWHPKLSRHLRVEHRMNAGEQARLVARNILGAGQEFAPVPFFWSDQGANKLVVHGHVGPEAKFSLHSGSLEEGSFAGTYRENGHTVAVMSWNSPKDATRLRREMLA